jgi:hypothetical protein
MQGCGIAVRIMFAFADGISPQTALARTIPAAGVVGSSAGAFSSLLPPARDADPIPRLADRHSDQVEQFLIPEMNPSLPTRCRSFELITLGHREGTRSCTSPSQSPAPHGAAVICLPAVHFASSENAS